MDKIWTGRIEQWQELTALFVPLVLHLSKYPLDSSTNLTLVTFSPKFCVKKNKHWTVLHYQLRTKSQDNNTAHELDQGDARAWWREETKKKSLTRLRLFLGEDTCYRHKNVGSTTIWIRIECMTTKTSKRKFDLPNGEQEGNKTAVNGIS